jgi:hypothetical protein
MTGKRLLFGTHAIGWSLPALPIDGKDNANLRQLHIIHQ